MAYGTFTLKGQHTTPTSTPHKGKVSIRPNAIIRDLDGEVIMSGAVSVDLDETGAWTVTLPAGDDARISPSEGLGYVVSYRLQSQSFAPETVFVAAQPTGSTFDVSQIVTSDPTTAVSTIVGPGVPAGGLAGYALVKTSDADYDTEWSPAGAGGGVTDHGLLTGLADDDHPHYHTDARGDARYYPRADVDTALALKAATNDARFTDARTPTAHAASHASGGSDPITPASIGAQPAGSYAAALGPDDNYVTDAEKVKLGNLSGTNTGDQVLPTWATISGKPAVIGAGATAADARTAIGAGTSSFSGAYADLTGKPTLGTAADNAETDFATAAQGAKADTALQPSTAQAINAQTGTSYTLQASDAGKLVTLDNTGAITLNAPGSVFTAGQRVDVLVLNTGMATVVGTSGATANGTPSLVSRARYSAFTVLWLSATSAVVVGDLA